MRRRTLAAATAAAMLAVAGCAADDGDPGEPQPAPPEEPGAPYDQPEPPVEPELETVVENLSGPWGLAFLPDRDRLLVTQSGGTLSVVDPASGEIQDIGGTPEVSTEGQGGLLDVTVDPDWPDSRWVYLTYSAAAGGGLTTHLARGQLDEDLTQLSGLEVLFAAEPARGGGAHFGSKVAFGPDGNLYLTVGDRGDKNFGDHPSQDTSNHLGTTIRLAPDGSVPEDNPFVDDPDVRDEIFSYGHRNSQGMAVHPATGEIWQSEHGERDGDEINILEAGGNFGWPEAATGCEYGTDTPVGDHPDDRDDLVSPVFYWECGSGGFPPAGMDFYTGDQFAAWEGDLLVAGLAGEYVARFRINGRAVSEHEPLLADQGWRFRNVAVSPHDGAVYLAVDGDDGSLVRLVNAATG